MTHSLKTYALLNICYSHYIYTIVSFYYHYICYTHYTRLKHLSDPVITHLFTHRPHAPLSSSTAAGSGMELSGEGKKKRDQRGSLGGGNLSKGISPSGQSVTLSKRMLLNLLAGESIKSNRCSYNDVSLSLPYLTIS